MAQEIYKWKCKKCKKEIKSMYLNQLNFNREQHTLSCMKKKGDTNGTYNTDSKA